MSNYYVFKMPKHANGQMDPDKRAELDALAAALAGNDRVVYVAGPHDTPEQKAAIKAVRNHLIGKGVPQERITTSKPVGDQLPLAAAAQR